MGSRKVGRYIRIITGHNALGYFANKVDNNINPTCRYCKENNETFWHFANECPVFRASVEDIMLGRDLIHGNWDVDSLLEIAGLNKIAEILERETEDCWLQPTDPEPD